MGGGEGGGGEGGGGKGGGDEGGGEGGGGEGGGEGGGGEGGGGEGGSDGKGEKGAGGGGGDGSGEKSGVGELGGTLTPHRDPVAQARTRAVTRIPSRRWGMPSALGEIAEIAPRSAAPTHRNEIPSPTTEERRIAKES